MVVSVFMVELVLVIVLSNNYSKKKTVQMANLHGFLCGVMRQKRSLLLT
jgi:hypothetical protein